MPLLLPIKRKLVMGDLVVLASPRSEDKHVRVYLVEVIELEPDRRASYEVEPDFFECRLDDASYSGHYFHRGCCHAAYFGLNSEKIYSLGRVSGSLCYDDQHEGFKFLRRVVKKHRKHLLRLLCHS